MIMGKWLLPFMLFAAASANAQQVHEHHNIASQPVTAKQKTSPEYSRFTREMNTGMSKMMKDMHSPGYKGDPDMDFLAMMIPHHEGAVEMARLILIHGRDPATRRLAEDIIAGQTVEIDGMKRRLAALRSKQETEGADFPALGGTRGPSK
jgi:uncharacterized protein (DUF305 family)